MSDSDYIPTVEQCKTKFGANWKARRHLELMRDEPDAINHCVIRLKQTLPNSPNADVGDVIVIGCCCGNVYWRNLKAVPASMLIGDWAAPFRSSLGLRTRPPTSVLKKLKRKDADA